MKNIINLAPNKSKKTNNKNTYVKASVLGVTSAVIILFIGFIYIKNNSGVQTQTYTSPTNSKTDASSLNTSSVLKNVKWSDEMEVAVSDSQIRIQANGIPNHKRDSQYAVPNNGVVVPDETTARIINDPTKEQQYDFKITTTPKFASKTTAAPLGSIGIMISGSVLFNPYEGDGKTVAMSSNFYLTDKNGNKVWFVDSCSGHPAPNQGEYHYHALSNCVTSEVDTDTGPSHITGIAFDGFPIYGNRDINGNKVDVSKLDECNGITSPTPEFPNGIYHYVLPGTNDATSSIRCFKGEVDTKQMMKMPPMMNR